MSQPQAAPASQNIPNERTGDGSRFPNALSRFVFTRTYPRWREDDKRRETYDEAVSRYVGFLNEERDLPVEVVDEIKQAILKMDVLPSMRAFWSAGKAAQRDNTMFYNCAFIPLDSLMSFAELLFILMQGTGIGYSVESKFVNNLPSVAPTTDAPPLKYVIPDTGIGWKDAVYDGLTHLFKGQRVEFDYSLLRPAGARLLTKGGRASGPGPLRNLLNFTSEIVLGAAGRKLTTVECNDIACMIGEIVMAGGVRRAALISFSDPEDILMRDAKKFPTCQMRVPDTDEKTGQVILDQNGLPRTNVCGHGWSNDLGDGKHLMEAHGTTPAEYLEMHPGAYMGFGAHRFMANNSAFWDQKPDLDTFNTEWKALRDSGSGERGFFMFPPAKRAARRSDCRLNPCGEILLRYAVSTDPWTGEGGGGQFCNLSAAVMRADDTRKSFAEKVRLAAWIGAIQSTFTYFPQLRPAWKTHCDEDRLLGVDITGHCDNPRLSGDPEALLYFNQVARESAAEAAAYLDIPMPAAVTCGKPSGNSSQMVDCASGFHTRFAPYYIRRIRISGTDPLFALARDSGVPVFKDNKYTNMPDAECPTWVVEFPVKSPEGALTRANETALQQLDRYLQIMRTWCGERGHNQSATVYVRDNEWGAVGEWLYEHFAEVTGLSFLPYDGGNYQLAPYEEITEDQYRQMASTFPVINYKLLEKYESEDMGSGSQELACVGGACEIDFSKEDMVPVPEKETAPPAKWGDY
mgnify:CR=1 FL=1|jgi:ribonucleoside-triphosphate reductase (thioredoxin)